MVRGVIDAGPVDCWQRPSRTHPRSGARYKLPPEPRKRETVAGSCAKSMGVATTASRFPGASSSKYSQTAWPDESLSRRRLHALAVVFKVAEPVRLSVDGLHPVMETFGDAVGTREAPHADNFLRPGMKRVAQRGGDCFGGRLFRRQQPTKPPNSASDRRTRPAAPRVPLSLLLLLLLLRRPRGLPGFVRRILFALGEVVGPAAARGVALVHEGVEAGAAGYHYVLAAVAV